MEFKSLKQIYFAGTDWLVWKLDDDFIYLLSVKTFGSAPMSDNIQMYDSAVKTEQSDALQRITSIVYKKLRKAGLRNNATKEGITLLHVDDYMSIVDAGYVLPPCNERIWWLGTVSDVNNYVYAVNSSGELVSMCAIYKAGIRPVIAVKRSCFDKDELRRILIAPVPLDERKNKSVEVIDEEYIIPSENSKEYFEYKMRNNETVYQNVKCYVVLQQNKVLQQTLDDRCFSLKSVCTIQDCEVLHLTVGKGFVYIVMSVAYNARSIKSIVHNIKRNLLPKSVAGINRVRNSILHKYWQPKCIISSNEISLEYIKYFLQNKKTAD